MKLNRLVAFGVFLTLTLSLCTAFRLTDDDEEPKQKPGFFPILHQNNPRVFGIFSKPPEKDAPKQTGPNIIGHLGNVLQGGSVGIELSARPLGTLIDHVKKILPGGLGTVGQPNKEKPYVPPKKEWETKNPDKEVLKEPIKEPEPGFNWDDIGEDVDQVDPSTEKPIEELIDPRVRPKRFIESKIYHVPLTFRSNAKPYKVVERTHNSLESKEKM